MKTTGKVTSVTLTTSHRVVQLEVLDTKGAPVPGKTIQIMASHGAGFDACVPDQVLQLNATIVPPASV